MKKKFLVLLSTLAIAGADLAQGAYTAILTGGDAGFAVWDNFGGTPSFTGLNPTSSSGGYNSSLLGSTTAGGFMSDGGNRIYGFTFTHELTLTANYSDTTTNTVMLQVVLSEPGSETTPPGATGAEKAKNYFDIKMNGVAPTSAFLVSSVPVPGGMSSVYYNWAFVWDTSALANGAALNFILDGYTGTQHVSLDAIALSAAPEPSRALLAFAGLGFLAMRRKRRNAQSTF